MAAGDLPVGFTLDQPAGLPAGFKLDAPQQTIWDKVKGELGAASRFTPMGIAASAVKGLDAASYKAGGSATDLAVQAGASPEVAAGIGTAANLVPQVAAGMAGGAATKAVGAQQLIEAGARRTMQSALKPTSKSLANGDAARAITTMLEDGVSVTPGGAAKLRVQIDKLKGEVGDLIQNSNAAVDKGYVLSEVSKTLDKFKKQVNPTSDLNDIRASWQEFSSLFPNTMPVQLAQDLKQGTQSMLRDKYGRTTTVTPASEATQKSMASGLRQGIEDAVPGVAERNSQASSLINVLKQIEPRSAMQANKDIFGLAALGDSPEIAALMLADRNPYVKSMLARILYQNSGTFPTAIGAGVAGTYAGRPQNK